MDKKIRNLFSFDVGKRIYNNAVRAITTFSMEEKLRSGVLVGLSGGADSVMLLSFLLEYRRRTADFKIAAVHVNHMIRGDEAERDEEFSRCLADELGVEFISRKVDVPKLAKKTGLGLEEAARLARYQIFEDIISGRIDLGAIAVAHNSTDNLETVVFNMLRGSSSVGLAGIPPVRDCIIRPLIFSEKEDILTSLLKSGISFVTDSTNFSCDYTRNYIRNEILKHFRKITPHPELSAERLSLTLRRDEDYLHREACRALDDSRSSNGVAANMLRDMHPAILSRAIGIFAKEYGVILENTHYSKLCELIYRGGRFSCDLPSKKTFISDGKLCIIANTADFRKSVEKKSYTTVELKLGENEIFDKEVQITVSLDKTPPISSNVYKISIQQAIRFDIMNERLYARTREDGDTFVAGGITRKVKKLFCDKKIPQNLRDKYPVICDSQGIVLLPGFTVPDRARPIPGEGCVYVTYAVRDGEFFTTVDNMKGMDTV